MTAHVAHALPLAHTMRVPGALHKRNSPSVAACCGAARLASVTADVRFTSKNVQTLGFIAGKTKYPDAMQTRLVKDLAELETQGAPPCLCASAVGCCGVW